MKNIKLAVPIFTKDNIYCEAEIIKPSGAVLADTKKAIDTGDFFSATRVFLIGCIIRIDDVTDKIAIKSLVNKIPYKTAEQLSLEIVKLYNPDDGVEGVYYCPRCKAPTIAELKNIDGMEIDTRDFISNLKTGYYDGSGFISHELTEPVLIKNGSTDEVIQEIRNFEMRFPTLEDGISAFMRYGVNDAIRLQFAMFVQALTKINGEAVDSRFKNAIGITFFEGIKDVRDIKYITDEINSYGIIPEIDRHCTKCGKDYKAVINTSNFFDSALNAM